MSTLPSGLRVVTDHVPDTQSVAVGIWVAVGTRNEDMEHNGAAHMVEHMLFKGTPTRNTKQIAEMVENVGGHINAYTGREMTSYHIHLLKNDLPMALEILADMYQNATLPQDEIERERGVILQEIGMGNDTPDELVFDHYYETAYPGQSLGAPILGKQHHIEGMTRDALTGYIKKFYTPARTVISVAGDIEHDIFTAQAEKLFGNLPKDAAIPDVKAAYGGGDHRLAKDLEQTHIILGFQGLKRTDERYYVATALSTLLGGGMSSRLFQEVREKRGLVYSIYSYHSGYRDSGQFAIYAGTGPDDLRELVPVVCDEVLKVMQDVTDEEVERAKAQIRSNLVIGRESLMTRADQHARYLVYRDQTFDLSELMKIIDAVDASAVKKLAQQIFSGKPTVAALGDLSSLESYDAIVSRLRH